jgi:hypothetical protein
MAVDAQAENAISTTASRAWCRTLRSVAGCGPDRPGKAPVRKTRGVVGVRLIGSTPLDEDVVMLLLPD